MAMFDSESKSIFYKHNAKETQETGTKQLCSLKETT